jgi:prepilin-type N-terminal cleavage/methylation domain-containing protein
MRTKKAMTLIELIVVITILAILATLGFISTKDVTKKARNSVRVSDLVSIKKSLQIYYTGKNSFPDPDYSINISYS